MEYLMTYGWAILVVMIVGIVMWQLGIFSMGSTTLTATGFAKLKPQLAATGLSTAGQFTGVFTNGVGTTIDFANVADIGTLDNTMLGTSCILELDNANTPAPIGAGGNFIVLSVASDCNGATPTVNPGDVYTAEIVLNYDVTIGTVSTSHSESGSLRGPYE
jgi:hypothetical protein